MKPTFRLDDRPPPALIPMAQLARLPPAAIASLLQQALASDDPAALLMNQYQIFSALGQREFALEMQARALQHSPLYRITATRQPTIRLLALQGLGDSTDNTPLDYLIEDSDIQLDLLYIRPDQPLPDALPEHDVLLVALGYSEKNCATLSYMEQLLTHWPRPVLNLPQHIRQLSRERLFQQLATLSGVLVAPTRAACRDTLMHMVQGHSPQAPLAYPLTLRPQDSQGGHGLQRLEEAAQLTGYLAQSAAQRFFVANFLDYRSNDGLYRKWRIALIAGQPYVAHLAIGSHWIVHYHHAGMAESSTKREEEARALTTFERDFALRHGAALRAIAVKLALEYVVLDCAETDDGRLLVFEADNRGWIHATDPPALFAYKQPALQKLFAAFRTLLVKTAREGCMTHSNPVTSP